MCVPNRRKPRGRAFGIPEWAMPGQIRIRSAAPLTGRRTGMPALSPAASAPAAFSAAIVNGSSGMHAESPWFPPMPASPDGINSRKRAYYPISRRIAQGGILQLFYK